MASHQVREQLPHALFINIPFPTYRLANSALRSLAVDEELSSLVKREFALISDGTMHAKADELEKATEGLNIADEDRKILQVHYKATTPRMLRVAVNGFFESLTLIVQVMEELDVDVIHEKGLQDLEGVQGIEHGVTGSAPGVSG